MLLYVQIVDKCCYINALDLAFCSYKCESYFHKLFVSFAGLFGGDEEGIL